MSTVVAKFPEFEIVFCFLFRKRRKRRMSNIIQREKRKRKGIQSDENNSSDFIFEIAKKKRGQ